MLSVLCLLSTAVLAILFSIAPTYVQPLALDAIKLESGHNFIATYPDRSRFPFAAPWDSSASPTSATAVVLENGRPLGPAHSQHASIRSAGGGRFSFWSGNVYFSTSDNSDPKENGRSYAIRYGTRPLPWIVAVVGILDFVVLCLKAKSALRVLRQHAGALGAVLLSLLSLRVLASASGFMRPVFEDSASALDGLLVQSIILHTLLGFAIAGLAFAAGCGLVIGFSRGRHPKLSDLLLRAFLPGVLVVLAAALVAVSIPHGRVTGLLICAAVALPLASYRPDREALVDVFRVLLVSLPASFLAATVMGFRFHGPTATLSGAPMGDTTIYVGLANTMVNRLFPLYNLGAEGFHQFYGNTGTALVAAALLPYKWFDPYLFFATSLVALTLLPIGALLLQLGRSARARGEPRLGRFDCLIVGGLIFGAFRFPSDMVGSPPFAFFIPVVFSTVYFWSISSGSIRSLEGSVVTGVLGSALSKVVSVVVLLPLALPDLATIFFRKAGRSQIVVVGAGAFFLLFYAAVLLATYLPFFSKFGGFGPQSVNSILIYHAPLDLPFACALARDLGALVLAIAVTGTRLPGLILGVWAGVAAYLVMPFLFYTSLTAAALTTALVYVVRPLNFVAQRRALFIAAVLLIPSTVFNEPGGTFVVVAWFMAVYAVLYASLFRGEEAIHRSSWDRHARPAGLLAALCAVLLWGAATGSIHVGPDTFLFTPDIRDIWLAVKQRTPVGSLIFTDQTGPTESRTGGWNDFALAAQRQFYIASWTATTLRFDAALRAARLNHNEAVLDGREMPSSLQLSRSYDGYYAVLAMSRDPPPGATLIYENASYRLFRIRESRIDVRSQHLLDGALKP